jgi:methyltransferase (TIGR00027 family)
MEKNSPSRSAQRVAMLRAAHQLIDHPNIFCDPLAVKIIGQENRAELEADTRQYDASLYRSLRASLVARSRYAEDELDHAVSKGVRQYVILGAGLDTFAYRNPWDDKGLRVFEVDHPDTQEWKRALLRDAEITVPDSVSFAQINFEEESLSDALSRAGFDRSKPSFFSWLGVTYYLTRDAIFETLRFASATAKGSAIVFDYLIDPSLMNPTQLVGFKTLSQRVALGGEPWQTFFNPASFSDELRALGFEKVDDVGPEQLNARYFKDRTDELKLSGASHLVTAHV